MATGRDDPYAQFSFLLQLNGVTIAGFSEVMGLSAEIDAVEYREGNESNHGVANLRKLVGLMKYTNIVCKHGFAADASLWRWIRSADEGGAQRQSGSIVLLDEGRNKVLSWSFHDGWPVKWDGQELNAETNEVAIEMLEIAHEGFALDP
jgi:phage tail-like protein